MILSIPMVLVAIGYPHAEWGRTLIGWLMIAWIAPIGFAKAYGEEILHKIRR